jgi:hypothetical protein
VCDLLVVAAAVGKVSNLDKTPMNVEAYAGLKISIGRRHVRLTLS